MRILVVDDEPLARKRLVRMLARIPGAEVAGEAGDAEEALAHVERNTPDLVLLDIRMPGLSGLELAASGRALPPIVFTTAYDQYAVDAFEVSAVDYLLKPVKKERLAAAIEKVRERTRSPNAEQLQGLLEKLERRVARGEPVRISARRQGTTRLFAASEIGRIYASSKYSLFRQGDQEFVLDESLNALESRLSDEGFVRVHRSELVNLGHVRALHTEDGSTTVELSDGQRAQVSRHTLPALKERLGL